MFAFLSPDFSLHESGNDIMLISSSASTRGRFTGGLRFQRWQLVWGPQTELIIEVSSIELEREAKQKDQTEEWGCDSECIEETNRKYQTRW